MAERYTGLPTGKKISEYATITRVAEAAIPILANQEYVPVIKGTANYQVLAATAAATTVVGFAKRPSTLALSAVSIPIGTTLTIVVAGVIKVPVSGASTAYGYLAVHTTTTQLVALSFAAEGDLAKCVARAIDVGTDTDIYVKVGL